MKSVMLAMPIHRDVCWQTAQSLLKTGMLFQQQGIPLEVTFLTNCSVVDVARSILASQFLELKYDLLMMIDSDQTWEPEYIIRLMELSEHMDIICGLYPPKIEPITFYVASEENEPFDMNEWGCIPTSGIGLGFTMVTRRVIEDLANVSNKTYSGAMKKHFYNMFHCDMTTPEFIGEDVGFFRDCKKLGYQSWIDPTLSIGHVGSKVYQGNVMDIIDVVG